MENITPSDFLEAAKYFYKKGDSDRAEYLFKLTLEDEESHEAYFFLGLLENQRGNSAKGLTHFYQSVELNPNYGNPCNEIGIILLRAGKEIEAVYWLKKSLRCELNDAPHISLYNLATLYKIWNRPERSLQYLHRAILIKPDFEEARKLKEELGSTI
ncbi:hypothetical protein [Leptospira mayottensis]|uniref:Tetratricopeptide repeat protein n=2 Tax=Leptospira mayottensis TaxID=1137606 RepID=A0AA87SUV2_9LEPT|nr:hypothetical protein [Leptospira mayottensis]AXR60836.1 tetratricopeptide repeat protein [Leptospira mayottensis]AXR64713.1 tetratricopeptide repeat protein [Leptospira mayottensis]AXR68415.1 tetratricopeptide repeat protein [Leptospira mayottensis]AZQ02733.1 tetratricopeptide repeat protein [Leptospira mayottensis 200901116]EKR98319.1 tetratricopeptide repeat protein [Leptospira mayottensis 200901122]